MNEINDHDLLTKVDTKLERVIKDIGDLSLNLTNGVGELQRNKVDKDEAERLWKEHEKVHADQEARIRKLEVIGTAAIVVVAIAEFVFRFFPYLKL